MTIKTISDQMYEAYIDNRLTGKLSPIDAYTEGILIEAKKFGF